MVACVASVDAVVAVGVVDFAEVLVSLYESLRVLVCVLRMHIVVGSAVAYEQRTVQLGRTPYRVGGIAVGVLFGVRMYRSV